MRRRALVLVAVAAIGCGGRDAPRDSAATSSAGTVSASAPTSAGKCPHSGLWSLCGVRERLDHAGLVPLPPADSVVRRAFFATPGVRYALGPAELEVFVYPDAAAAARDVAALDTVTVAPRGQRADWPSPPTFIRSANLIAILLTPNERQIERVQLALTAGPPSADRPGEQQAR